MAREHGTADAPGPPPGRPTSWGTLASLVMRTFELADIRDGDKVLEIGTGTGCCTAILCHRVGDRLVYSVEYDAESARTAAEHLRSADCALVCVVGYGLRGHRDGPLRL